MTNPNTAEVSSEHAIWPQDPQFDLALAGGVTTMHILPGSGNLFGGRSVTVKNVPARTADAMKFPGAPYGLKMACGENPMRVYGGRNTHAVDADGQRRGYRKAWQAATEYRERWKQVEARTARIRPSARSQPAARDADGRARRRDPDPEPLLPRRRDGDDDRHLEGVRLQDRVVPPRGRGLQGARPARRQRHLRAACGPTGGASSSRPTTASRRTSPLVHESGGCAIVHSDSADGIQRLNQEAAKAIRAGARGRHHDQPRRRGEVALDQSGEGARDREDHRIARAGQERGRRDLVRRSVQRLRPRRAGVHRRRAGVRSRRHRRGCRAATFSSGYFPPVAPVASASAAPASARPLRRPRPGAGARPLAPLTAVAAGAGDRRGDRDHQRAHSAGVGAGDRARDDRASAADGSPRSAPT